MTVLLTMLSVIAAAVAGTLLYRWGWLDGRDAAKPAKRAHPPRTIAQADTQEWVAKQLAELADFMQYDGSDHRRGDD